MNAALVAPQLAVDALDSSPGHFYEPGFFTSYLNAAEDRFAALSNGRATKQALQRLPVIIVAYSGGYLATAFTLQYEPPEGRIRGVVLLDALFGEADRIERWIVARHDHAFFVSAFSKAASPSQHGARVLVESERRDRRDRSPDVREARRRDLQGGVERGPRRLRDPGLDARSAARPAGLHPARRRCSASKLRRRAGQDGGISAVDVRVARPHRPARRQARGCGARAGCSSVALQ